jgi:hypothetical protein
VVKGKFGSLSSLRLPYKLWISIFQAIAEFSQLEKSNFAVLVLAFEKLGWNFTIVGGQPKTPSVGSIVYKGVHFRSGDEHLRQVLFRS